LRDYYVSIVLLLRACEIIVWVCDYCGIGVWL